MNHALDSGRLRWRWLLLCVPVAVWVSLWFVPERPPLLPALVVLGAAALALLLYRMDSISPSLVPVWLVLVLFLALYFVRLGLLLDDPTRLDRTFADHIIAYFHTGRNDLGSAFAKSMMVFVPYCVAVFGMLTVIRKLPNPAMTPLRLSPTIRWQSVYLLGIVMLMVVSGFVAHRYRIGQMGVDPGEPLPYRLKGIVFYGRTVIVPLLILAVIYLGHASEKRWLVLSGLALLVIHGISEMVLRGSRSSLMLIVLLAVLLAGSGGFRLKRGSILLLGVALFAAVWLMPVVMNYRILRMGSDAAALELLRQALGAARLNVLAVLMEGLTVIYFRIPGIETIWSIIGFNGEPLGLRALQEMRTPFGITGYLNFVIYKIPMEVYTLYAPGLVGWLYLAGGHSILIAGGALLGVLCVMVPRLIYRSSLYCKPIANTFFLWILFVSMTDATIDGNVLMLATGIVGLILVEFVLRRVDTVSLKSPV